jgi:hypothetical protein
VHDPNPDPRDILTWYRTTIKGLPNVAPYNDWAHIQIGPPGAIHIRRAGMNGVRRDAKGGTTRPN